jgi:hypothetical protein
MPIEVKPNAITMPLSESKGLSLRIPLTGPKALGAVLVYEGLETQEKGEIKYVQKPQVVPIKGLAEIINHLNSKPQDFVELAQAFVKLQSGAAQPPAPGS